MKNIIFLGAPGSGKGTQASRLCEEFGFLKISTGDLIRAELGKDSALGRSLKSIVESGALVPDEIMIELFKQTIISSNTRNGLVLDGFPRTVDQAISYKKLSKEMALGEPIIFYLNVSLESLFDRLLGRLTCSSCQAIFHTTTCPPKIENKCDKCGAELIKRADDTREVIKNRFEVFENQIKAVLEFYSNSVHHIDAQKDSESVYAELVSVLN